MTRPVCVTCHQPYDPQTAEIYEMLDSFTEGMYRNKIEEAIDTTMVRCKVKKNRRSHAAKLLQSFYNVLTETAHFQKP